MLCRIGLHSRQVTQEWEPSIQAKIVTRFTFTIFCRRCGKIIHKLDRHWDESKQNFVEG